MRPFTKKMLTLATTLALAGCYAAPSSADTGGYVDPYGTYQPGPALPVQYDDAQPSPYDNAPPPPPDYNNDYGAAQPAQIGEVDVNVFVNQLSPYGRWIDVPEYGRCWTPNGVAADWRPYTVGHWVYSTYGWTWVSEEPFGWATCHYGRWTLVPRVGWCWVPGTIWAPAWVAWRAGDGYCGWAALPPRDHFRERWAITARDIGDIPASHFCFVNERFITERHIHRHAVPVRRNTTIINKTTNVTNIRVVNNNIVNEGVPVDRIERSTGRRIERVRVKEVRDRNEERNVRDPKTVAIYRPPAARTVTVPQQAVRRDDRDRRDDRRVATPNQRQATPAPSGQAQRPVRPNERPLNLSDRPSPPADTPRQATPPAQRRSTPSAQPQRAPTPPAARPATPPAQQPAQPRVQQAPNPPAQRPVTPPAARPANPPAQHQVNPSSERRATPPAQRPPAPSENRAAAPAQRAPALPPQRPPTPPAERQATPPAERPPAREAAPRQQTPASERRQSAPQVQRPQRSETTAQKPPSRSPQAVAQKRETPPRREAAPPRDNTNHQAVPARNVQRQPAQPSAKEQRPAAESRRESSDKKNAPQDNGQARPRQNERSPQG